MVVTAAELALDARAELGEGPVWDEETAELVWVDIMAGRVNRVRPADGRISSLEVGQPVGSFALRRQGGLVLAVRDGFALLDPGAVSLRMVARVEDDIPDNRMNDGKCDPAGRFWAGTMSLDEAPERGALYRLATDLTATRVLDGVTVSNGIDWSPDGRVMYYVDSALPRVDALDFDVASGAATSRRTVIALEPGAGTPDGLTVDAEGHIWLCLWDGWEVRRYTADGVLEEVVRLPVSRVTSCVFGGAGFDELYITSASIGLEARARTAQPLAGGIFRCRPGVRGLPARRFEA
jgi:sugar lactone lactonase YvrE